jgi:hypothetical protein
LGGGVLAPRRAGCPGPRPAPTLRPVPGFRPLADGEPDVAALSALPECGWITRKLKQRAPGYAIASRIPGTGRLRFIEVKGRVAGAATITVTKNEIV